MATFVKTKRLEPYEALDPTLAALSAEGKSVLVTGGGYGIGKSIAEAFAIAKAARVAIAGRTESKLQETVAELEKQHPMTDFSYFAADISDPAGVKSMFNSFGAPDILINNAGFLPQPEIFKTVDLKDWWEGFEINVLGTALVIQTYLRAKAPEREGVVITLSSVAAHWGQFPQKSAYSASKAACLRMIELFQCESPEVRFVSVHPGTVRTAMAEKAGLSAALPSTNPVLVADFILWCSSAEADFLKGRFAWANWDVDELKAKRQEILENELLQYTIAGFERFRIEQM